MHIVGSKKDMAGTAGVKRGDSKITNENDGTHCVQTRCSKTTAKHSRNIINHGMTQQNGTNKVCKTYNIDSEVLAKAFSELTVDTVDCSSSSEDEDEDDPELIAKSPDRAKENKQKSRTLRNPYSFTQIRHNSGGELVYNGTFGTLDGHIDHNQLYFDGQNTQIQIPQTVEDISNECYIGTSNESDSGTEADHDNEIKLSKVWETHSELLNECLNILVPRDSEKLVSVPEQDNIPTEESIQADNWVPHDLYYISDPVHSIDSNYGTLSSPESITLEAERLQSLSPVFTRPSSSSLRLSFDSDTGISTSPCPDHSALECATYTSPCNSLGHDSLSSNPEEFVVLSKIDYTKDAGTTRQSGSVRPQNYNSQDTVVPPVTMKIAPPDLNQIRSIGQPKLVKIAEQTKSRVSNYSPSIFNMPSCILIQTTQTITPSTTAAAPIYTIAPPTTAPALNRTITPSMTTQSSIRNITCTNAILAPTYTIAPPNKTSATSLNIAPPSITVSNSIRNISPAMTAQSSVGNITCTNTILAPTYSIAPPNTAAATSLNIASPSITAPNSIRNITSGSTPVHIITPSITSRASVHIISPPPTLPGPSSTTSDRFNITHPQIKPGGVAVTESIMRESGITRMKVAMLANNSIVQKIWIHVSLENEEFYAIDDSGKTSLMNALRQPLFPSRYMEEIYVRIERIKKDNDVDLLKKRCLRNQSVLYIAAIECAEHPLLARYITDVLVELGADPDEVYDDQNSLLHVLCRCGDSHANVVAELLNAKRPNGEKCFNVNRTNHTGATPLHVAVQMGSNSIAIAKLLVYHGANLKAQDNNGLTPLMTSVRDNGDPLMVKVLLQHNWQKDIINMEDQDSNTALHFAASNNKIPLHRQKQVIDLLINFGAAHNSRNSTGRLALALVDPTRKDEIRKIIQRK